MMALDDLVDRRFRVSNPLFELIDQPLKNDLSFFTAGRDFFEAITFPVIFEHFLFPGIVFHLS